MPPLNGNYPVGTTASFTCDHGYSQSGSSTRTCQDPGIWNQQETNCIESNENHTYFYNSNRKSESTCSTGVITHGSLHNYFTVVTCPPLSLANGEITYDMSPLNENYPVGTAASFSCDYGYSQLGTSTSTCQDSGIWNHQTPMCIQSKEIFWCVNKMPRVLCKPLHLCLFWEISIRNVVIAGLMKYKCDNLSSLEIEILVTNTMGEAVSGSSVHSWCESIRDILFDFNCNPNTN